MPERVTKQLVAVLQALLADSDREWYGLELMEVTGLSSGTLYPLLHRLVLDGWLVRTREARSDIGGTERRLYKLSGVGQRVGNEILRSRSTRGGEVATSAARVRVQPA
jgi:DNA-binding PadR family transcriptional regulator